MFTFVILCWLSSVVSGHSVHFITRSKSTHMKLDIFLGNWLRHGLIAGGNVPRVPLRMSLRRRLKPQELYRKVLLVEVVFFAYRGLCLCANLACRWDQEAAQLGAYPCALRSPYKMAHTITSAVNTSWKRKKGGRQKWVVVVWGGDQLKPKQEADERICHKPWWKRSVCRGRRNDECQCPTCVTSAEFF